MRSKSVVKINAPALIEGRERVARVPIGSDDVRHIPLASLSVITAEEPSAAKRDAQS